MMANDSICARTVLCIQKSSFYKGTLNQGLDKNQVSDKIIQDIQVAYRFQYRFHTGFKYKEGQYIQVSLFFHLLVRYIGIVLSCLHIGFYSWCMLLHR